MPRPAVRHKRILDEVGGRIGGRQGDGDEEVGRGEAEEHQDEDLARPSGQQMLQHGDRSLAVRRLAGHIPVDRQRTEQGQRDEDDGRERRERPGGEGGDTRLVAERREVVDAGEAHDLPPRIGLVFM